LTTGLGYSSSAAFRRIESARLSRIVPDVERKLASGDLNLTNVAKARSSIRAQEKKSGRAMAPAEQAEVMRAIENQTTAEAEITLLELLPDTASIIHRERTKRLDPQTERLTLNLTNADVENLAWIKDFLSHAMPEATNGEIFARLMAEFRAKKSTAAAAVTRLKAERRRCEYKDEATGRVCGSTLRVELDHVVPRALGGLHRPENLRCLCRVHNQFTAERELGANWARSWRRNPHP